jgi:hypothetical protein
MKKILMLSFLFVMFFNLESYAGRGFFGCCCGDDDIVESYDISNKPLITESVPTGPIPSEVTVSNWPDFKRYIVADGDCNLRIPVGTFFDIEETIKSGRGHKSLTFEVGGDKPGNGLSFLGSRVTFLGESGLKNGGPGKQEIFRYGYDRRFPYILGEW